MRFSTRTLKITAWSCLAVLVGLLTCSGLTAFGGFEIGFGMNLRIFFADAGSIYIVWPHTPVESSSFFNLEVSWYIWPRGKLGWWPQLIREYYWGGLFLPLWLPAAMCLAIGVPAFVTLRRRARELKNGACPKCGFYRDRIVIAPEPTGA